MILVAQGTVISSQQYMNLFLLGPSDYDCQDSGPLLLQVAMPITVMCWAS